MIASGDVHQGRPKQGPEIILRTFESHVRSAQAAAIQNTQFILRLIPGVLPRLSGGSLR